MHSGKYERYFETNIARLWPDYDYDYGTDDSSEVSQNQKVGALALREAGVKQKEELCCCNQAFPHRVSEGEEACLC